VSVGPASSTKERLSGLLLGQLLTIVLEQRILSPRPGCESNRRMRTARRYDVFGSRELTTCVMPVSDVSISPAES